ncbi:MAG: O-antigen ligase family protein [Austwickia sp.]|jgi:teichuronic acid biosynthesis protein TuaE|nr:O-antigen ligase family protein [Austwickia sp.]MBK8436823.1 O-antigen ligase family protein [Austwickia sp.]MBK9100451.1 O-antigen ligase family protein [Austwickia sp.]
MGIGRREGSLGASAGSIGSALALFVLVPVVAAGGLVTKPLNEAGHTVAVFAVVALLALPALRRTRWWRHPAPALLAAFWALFWALAPRALAAAPDGRLGRKELTGLAICTFVSIAAVAWSRGSRAGLQAFRWGWVAALLLTGGIGVWEVLTGRHLWTPDWAPWRFGEGSVISSTFINPNNFSDALVGMLAGVVALWAGAGRTRVLRWVLAALAIFAVVLMVFTQSRGGLVGAIVIVALEALRRRRAAGARSVRELLARQIGGHRAAAGALALALGAGLIATFVVPALAARNPVRAMLDVAFSEGQARSDSLRLSLIRFAFGYLRDAGWSGSGAGSFEPLFWNDPARGGLPPTNLHNAFVELLTQYGVWVFAPYLALLLVLVWAMLRGRTRGDTQGGTGGAPGDVSAAGGEPDGAGATDVPILRAELAGQLTAFALLGATASSALEIPFWWLSLANAVALAWHLSATSRATANPPASVEASNPPRSAQPSHSA